MTLLEASIYSLHILHGHETKVALSLGVPAHAYKTSFARDVTDRLNRWRDEEMARSKKQDNNNFGNTFFANVRLDARDRAAYENWLVGAQEAQSEVLAGLLLDGWKISMSWNNETDSYICAATQKHEKNVNYGAVITSFSDDWLDALLTTAYKIIVVVGDDTLSKQQEGSRWG